MYLGAEVKTAVQEVQMEHDDSIGQRDLGMRFGNEVLATPYGL